MRKIAVVLLVILTLVSCQEEAGNGNVFIKGKIEGLKQGNLLLQRIQDSTLVTLDSIAIDGDPSFELSGIIDEPQLVYLHLDLKDGTAYDDRLGIFAEEGEILVDATLEDFEQNAKVSGSKNDSVLSLFKRNKKRLDATYTKLVRRSLELSQAETPNPTALEKLDSDYAKHLRKRILFALNFAKINRDLEVAPYILVSEAFDANPKLLDSTYQMMPKKIQNSRYGKELSGLIELSKKENGL